MKEYVTIKIEAHDHNVMKDVKRLEGTPVSIQVKKLLQEKYPNMYKELSK